MAGAANGHCRQQRLPIFIRSRQNETPPNATAVVVVVVTQGKSGPVKNSLPPCVVSATTNQVDERKTRKLLYCEKRNSSCASIHWFEIIGHKPLLSPVDNRRTTARATIARPPFPIWAKWVKIEDGCVKYSFETSIAYELTWEGHYSRWLGDLFSIPA